MPETTTLTPHLVCRDAVAAIDFYREAFGAEALCVQTLPDGTLMHGCLSIDGATFFLTEGCRERGANSPLDLGGTPVTLALNVRDCDAVFERAVKAGCKVEMPLEDMFWGDRWGLVSDPYGHSWSISTTIRQVSPEELREAVAAFA